MENVSKYCYDNGVLKNKFDILDQNTLQKIERGITTYRISQLRCIKNFIHDFSRVDSYLKIHKYLFGDIYSFAGEIRDEAIYKSNEPYYQGKTPFCYPSFIYEQLSSYLNKMFVNLRGVTSREDMVRCISYYYGEINMVHPFREGNGRTLRIFMELLVEEVNHYLSIPDMEIHYSNWDIHDRDELLKATIYSSITGDNTEIEKCYDKVLVYSDEKKKSR